MRDNVDPIPIPEEIPQNKKIAWWLENSFIRSIKRLINDTSAQIRQILSFSLKDTIESFENDLIPLVQPPLQIVLDNPNVPEWFKTPIRKALSGESQAGIAILAIVVPALASALQAGFSGPIGRIIEAVLDQVIRSRLLDPGTLVAMWQRGIIDDGTLQGLLAKNGVNNIGIEALKKLSFRTEDETELTQAYWRKNVSKAYVQNELAEQGYTDQQIHHWLQAREVIPSPSDLVAMSVREAFSDDVARRFGYDDNYPSEAAEWAEKQGLSQEWFKRYWRAHWQLPGVTQVREMWRRGIIEQPDVDRYLLAADLPTFWREAIQKWMSAEITRVDVRRLYDLGVIAIQDVYIRYQRLGYSEGDAALMTQWTAAAYMNDERELTKSDILSMYKDGILDEREASTYLDALDYRESDVSLLLAHQDLKREQEYESRVIEIIKELFVRGVISRTDVFSELGKLDTPGHFIEDSLAVWDLEKKRKVITPSLTQLRDMALKEIITSNEFVVELQNKGYNDKYIRWYEQLWFTGE